MQRFAISQNGSCQVCPLVQRNAQIVISLRVIGVAFERLAEGVYRTVGVSVDLRGGKRFVLADPAMLAEFRPRELRDQASGFAGRLLHPERARVDAQLSCNRDEDHHHVSAVAAANHGPGSACVDDELGDLGACPAVGARTDGGGYLEAEVL